MHIAPRSILVGVGPNPASGTLVVAAALARRENARLTVLAAETRPSVLIWASPFMLPLYDPHAAAEEECESRLRAAVARLPADVPVTALLRREPAAAALLAELRAGGHDLVVIGRGRPRRIGRRLARTLRRRGAPVLVVDAARPSDGMVPDAVANPVTQGA